MHAPPAPRSRPGGLEELSPRLQQTLLALAEGLRIKQVADRLGLSFYTVQGWVRDIYRLLGLEPGGSSWRSTGGGAGGGTPR